LQIGNKEECPIQVDHIFSVVDTHTYTIGCMHRPLAVVTVNFVDDVCNVTLLLDEESVASVWFDAGGYGQYPSEDIDEGPAF